MAGSSTTVGRKCPNCGAVVPAGRRQCLSCKLDVSKMDGFEAAQRAARQRGVKRTEVETNEPKWWQRPGTYIKVVLLLVVIGGAFWMFRPKPPRYLQLPGTAQGVAEAFTRHIAGGTDKEFDQAYFLIADSPSNPKTNDERADYIQVFNVMSNYLSGEFGNDWIARAVFAPDVADPNLIVAKVDVETLHIHVAQQTPAEKLAKQGPHYAVVGMDEFNPNDAADFRKMEGIKGVIRTVGGQGAVSNLETILGAHMSNMHQPRMVKKVGLLAVIRNPRSASWQSIVQTYPLREDPVVQNRLKMISEDERYEPVERTKAKEVLDDRVSEEDKIAVGL